jgi:heat shock protein HtpX
LILLILGYLIYPLIQLAISRKREYLADAGSVELTKDKFSMISVLQKISQDPVIESIKKDTVAAMCIQTPFAQTRT